jgi:NADH-quinone oxidoreductase subunit M
VSGFPLLTALVVWPAVAALLVLALGLGRGGDGAVVRAAAVAAALVELALAAAAIGPVVAAGGAYALGERVVWLPYLGIDYRLGVDGISLVLVLLTALVGVVLLFTFDPARTPRPAQFLALLLLAEGAAMGIFLALDLVLFYLFWEAVLVPVYLLIAGWGGEGRRTAAMRFLIMSLVGSLFMLVGIVGLGTSTAPAMGAFTFDLPDLLAARAAIPGAAGYLAFFAFALAFAVKGPLFPFHAWQPDAYAEAPTPATILLASVLSKAGVYGFLRFLIPLFPVLSHRFADLFMLLGVAGVLYGAFIALIERDMKRLMAYASLSHMGLMVAGAFAMNAVATEGTVLQMVSHGVVIAAVFAFVAMLEARVGSRDIGAFGGLMTRAPVLAGFGMLVALAALGLPGLSSFAGEFLLLVGLFQRSAWLAVVATTGVVLAAAYVLRLYQASMHGPLSGRAEGDQVADGGRVDLRARDYAVLVPLMAVAVYLGVLPRVVPDRVAPSLAHVSVAAPASAPQAVGAGSRRLNGEGRA